MQKKFRLSILTLSLGLAPAIAMADSNADILKEIDALKAKVQQLEAQVQANQKATEEAAQVATTRTCRSAASSSRPTSRVSRV